MMFGAEFPFGKEGFEGKIPHHILQKTIARNAHCVAANVDCLDEFNHLKIKMIFADRKFDDIETCAC